MAIFRLVQHFEARTELPIDLNEATHWLLENRIQDEINFVGVSLDTGIIRGFLKRFKRPQGGWDIEPEHVSNIYYDHAQGPDWIQVVIAKELLHILDSACVTTKEQFEKLTQRLTLPTELQHLLEDPDYALVDKFGTAPASALLLPRAAREEFYPLYKSGHLTANEIARIAAMPVEHVRAVMSDDWPQIYDLIRQS